MKTITLGPAGSYSHEAALASQRLAPAPIVFAASITEALQQATKELCSVVIPIANSTEGEVDSTLKFLSQQTSNFPLQIQREIEIPVRHCLAATRGTRSVLDLKSVISHPQAIRQCKVWIERYGFQTQETASTALAAKHVSDNPHLKLGAIASRTAADIYNLEIVANDIQTENCNATRFFLFSDKTSCGTLPTGNDKTAIILRLPNQSGVLAKALTFFGERNINMEAIFSVALGKWQYAFYIEITGHKDSPAIDEVLRIFAKEKDRLLILGSFPKAS